MPQSRRRLRGFGSFVRHVFARLRNVTRSNNSIDTSAARPSTVSEIPLPFGPAPFSSCLWSRLASLIVTSEIPLPFGPAPYSSCLRDASAVDCSEVATCDEVSTATDACDGAEDSAAVTEECDVSDKRKNESKSDVDGEKMVPETEPRVESSAEFKSYLLTGKHAPKIPSPLLSLPPDARTTSSLEDERPIRRYQIDLCCALLDKSYFELSGNMRVASQIGRRVAGAFDDEQASKDKGSAGVRRTVHDLVEAGSLLALRRAHRSAFFRRQFAASRS